MTATKLVADTCVVMDSEKDEAATDAPRAEVVSARELRAMCIEGRVRLVYSRQMLMEWTSKRLIEKNALLAYLFRYGKIELIGARNVSRAERNALGKYVAHDDQQFLFAAEALLEAPKRLVTRDPRTTTPQSRAHVKKKYGVVTLLASEFVEGEQ